MYRDNAFHFTSGPFDLSIIDFHSRRDYFFSKIIELAVIIFLAACLKILVRQGPNQADLSMPWFLALVIFGFLSTNTGFERFLGATLSILYPPLAVVFITFAILLGMITELLISFTRLRRRQMSIVRRLTEMELALQYTAFFHSARSES